MRLATIREEEAGEKGPERSAIRMPRNAEEAAALFRKGLREMDARNDQEAFGIFDYLSHYEGDAPPELFRSARAIRDFLDPARSVEEKARTLFYYFSPTLIRVYPEGETEVHRER
jgi:hypothetical protein